jgi:hypothetical protein
MHHNKIGVNIDDKLEATSLKNLKNKQNKTICQRKLNTSSLLKNNTDRTTSNYNKEGDFRERNENEEDTEFIKEKLCAMSQLILSWFFFFCLKH